MVILVQRKTFFSLNASEDKKTIFKNLILLSYYFAKLVQVLHWIKNVCFNHHRNIINKIKILSHFNGSIFFAGLQAEGTDPYTCHHMTILAGVARTVWEDNFTISFQSSSQFQILKPNNDFVSNIIKQKSGGLYVFLGRLHVMV